ncbi:uncharacterized protein [Branchiostoma lanceolatum]|uniref:uncharacterized protein n=1 Tax=Branchiostoma lanceolatum TaxID=7740 RepID=UPI003456CB67
MLMEGGTPDVLQQRAQTAGLMFREPTPKDGNCFFWAINDQLQRDALRKERAKTMDQGDIREAVTCYIKDHPKTTNGESIVAFTAETSLDEYLAKMSQNGSWADHIYVQATADFLKRTIHIVSTSGGEDGCFICVEPIGGESEGTPLLLGHYAERHYQSLDTTAALGSSPPPLQGSSPSPLQGSSPPPLQGSSPPPLQGSSPPPLQGSSPSPLQGSSPSPLQGSSPPPLQGSSPSPLHDYEVSIAMRYHSLLGPESIGDTPPVRRRQSENGDMQLTDAPSDLVEVQDPRDSLQSWLQARDNFSADLLFGPCEEAELKGYFTSIKPFLQRLADGEIPDNKRHSTFFGQDEEGNSTRRKLYMMHKSGAFTEEQATFIGKCIMKEVKIPLEMPLLMEYQIMVLLPEALAAIYQVRKGTTTLEEARNCVWRAGFREDL